MAVSTDFVAAGGGAQGIGQPMDLALTVQQTAPIDIKQFLDTTLVSWIATLLKTLSMYKF
jgi:hypothetical protein